MASARTLFSSFLSPATSLFRLPTSTSVRLCPRCSRYFSSSRTFHQSSKRALQTATAYHPSSLQPDPPPPRNSGIPDTSIAGGAEKADNVSQRRTVSQEQKNAAISEPESEAQKTKPVAPSQSPTSSQTPLATSKPATRPRSKLRARKAAITLTPTAISALEELLDQPDPKLIRVGVKNRGCSGLAYHLEYVDKPGQFDEVIEQNGVQVLVDSKALFSIIGSEMDWVEDKLSRRFVFKNPNITEQCGCGESFSIS